MAAIEGVITNIETISIAKANSALFNSFQKILLEIEEKFCNLTEKTEKTNLEDLDDLMVVTPPFLKEIDKKLTYTLVLDLDETLVHYQELEDGG